MCMNMCVGMCFHMYILVQLPRSSWVAESSPIEYLISLAARDGCTRGGLMVDAGANFANFGATDIFGWCITAVSVAKKIMSK